MKNVEMKLEGDILIINSVFILSLSLTNRHLLRYCKEKYP